jgi:hypothetical protein
MSFVSFQTPPASFFTIDGIFQHRYDPSVVSTFNAISTIVNIDSSGILPDPFNNRMESTKGKYMSFQQMQEYKRQIATFQRVYKYNYNQWICQTPSNPAQAYRFITYKELNDYRASLAIINKLYNVSEVFDIQNMFVVPFPPFAPGFPNPT